jgi:hypothetical protein
MSWLCDSGYEKKSVLPSLLSSDYLLLFMNIDCKLYGRYSCYVVTVELPACQYVFVMMSLAQ